MIKHMIAVLLLSMSCSLAAGQAGEEQLLKAGIDAYTKQGNSSLARQSFLSAIELNNNFAAPKFNLAQLAEEEERWVDAIKWYSEYLNLDKTSSYADIAERKIEQIKRYIDTDKTPEGKRDRIFIQYLQKSQAQLSAGNIGASIAYSELAISYRPERYEAYLMYALALMDSEHYSEAITKLNMASQYSSGSEKEDIARIILQCKESLTQTSKIQIADSLFEQKDFSAAAVKYSEIWMFIGQSEFGFLAARSWVLAGQEDKAITIYDQLAKSKSLQVASKAINEKSDLGRSATKQLNAISISVSKEDILKSNEFVQAIKLLEDKKYYEADAQLTQVLEGLLPTSEYAVMFDVRGIARNGQQEYQSAIQDFSLALILNPHLIDALVHRAESYAGLGQYDNAVKDLDRAIELHNGVEEKEALRLVKKTYLSKLGT